MNISEVKTYLNKPVYYSSRKFNIENAEYILTACILKQNSKGEYYYLAELTDAKQRMNVIIVILEDVITGGNHEQRDFV